MNARLSAEERLRSTCSLVKGIDSLNSTVDRCWFCGCNISRHYERICKQLSAYEVVTLNRSCAMGCWQLGTCRCQSHGTYFVNVSQLRWMMMLLMQNDAFYLILYSHCCVCVSEMCIYKHIRRTYNFAALDRRLMKQINVEEVYHAQASSVIVCYSSTLAIVEHSSI